MNLALAFAAAAEKHGTKTAIFWGEDHYSYELLLTESRRLGNHLRNALGVKAGDRVGIWLKNCPEFVPALFGIFMAGGVVAPINNFLKPAEVNYILADAGIDLLITDGSTTEAWPEMSAARPSLKFLIAEQFANLQETRLLPIGDTADYQSALLDLAVLIYTSGTTGRPKGAMLSHGNLLANVESCRVVLSAIDADRFVVLLPMFHSFMLTVGVLLPLIVGGSLVIVKSLHPPKNVILEILHHQATILPAIPQFFRALANAQLPPRQPLRICISGGAPLPGEILREFNQKVPHVPLIEGYGLSEASPVVSVNPVRGPWKAGSIGVPIPGVEVTIQDTAGRILPVGQTGEVCVRGANVMQGYWNQPEETAQVMRNGWLLTGDVGHCDTDGYFYITDRKKDMLLVNGINVYPREIEEAIYQFPGIKEAAVIGVRDERRGEQPLAYVALNTDPPVLDEHALLQFLRHRLADYKVPRRVILLPALPRNSTGKILKTALREMADSQILR